MGAGLSQNIWTLSILRFFAGLAFSPSLSIGAGTISDINKAEHRAVPSCLYIMSPFLGPSLGYPSSANITCMILIEYIDQSLAAL